MAAPQIRRVARPVEADCDIAEEDEYYVTRPHTSVRRYRQPVERDTLDDFSPEQSVIAQRRRVSSATTGARIAPKAIEPLARQQRRGRGVRWMILISGLLLALGLIVGLNALSSWWQMRQNDATYGFPRTYQVNAVVAHDDSTNHPSHFIFMNLNGHIVIVEFPGGDAAHAMIYTGPTLFGNGSNLIPVTGEFKDVNGDHKLDMIVHIQDQTIVFLNTGTTFRPLQPGEQVQL